MKKIIALIIIITAAVFAAVFFYHQRHQKTEPSKTIAVSKGTIIEKAEAVGYIKPKQSITVKSQIDGTVKEVYHDEGEFVRKGEPLVKVDPSPSPADYATAKQQLSDAVERERFAKDDLMRYRDALKKKLITTNFTQYIQAKNTYETTKLSRTLAAQKLALLEKGATKIGKKPIANVVVSPVDGYLLNRAVNVGDPVLSIKSAQASTPLFTIADMKELMFEGVVDETDSAKIHIGMPANVIVGAFSDEPITGTLTNIALQSEKENAQQNIPQTFSGTESPFNVGFKIKISNLKIPKNIILRSGYSATAEIHIQTAKNVPVLPIRVIRFKDHQSYVLLPPIKKDGKPQERAVKTGLSDDMNIEIRSGLKLGDKALDMPEKTENDND